MTRTAAAFQNCDDFSTATQAPTDRQRSAYQIADALGYSMTFQFNRALQGATHALAGRPCEHGDDAHYAAGYAAATA